MFTLVRLSRVTSTQDWVRDWAKMGAREGLVVVAREQTAGRGRLDRRWESRPGGVYVSVLLRPGVALARAPQVTMLASLSVVEVAEARTGVLARPKWPNDVLVGGRKLAGILTEMEGEGQEVSFIVMGVGINVNQWFEGTPLAATATSLRMETGRVWDVEAVLQWFLDALARRYRAFLQGYDPHADWERDLEPVGRRVQVLRQGQPVLEGWAVGVSPEGALWVEDGKGVRHEVWAGDVVPLDEG